MGELTRDRRPRRYHEGQRVGPKSAPVRSGATWSHRTSSPTALAVEEVDDLAS